MKRLFSKRARSRTDRPTLRRMFQRIHIMIIAVTLLLAGIPLSLLSLFTLRTYAEHNLHLVAMTISYTSEAAVVFNDKPAALDALNMIAKREQIAEATITDVQHQVWVRWNSSTPSHESLNRLLRGWLLPSSVSGPIEHNGQLIGFVTLKADGSMLMRFLGYLLLGLLCCLILIALLSLYLVRRMHAGIVDELYAIAKVARQVREQRTYSLRVPHSQIAEIEELSRGFNSLLTEVESQHTLLINENGVLTYKALHDPLTGLPNRTCFMNMLESFNPRQERVCVMFLDGDGFKAVNDTWGHAAGDRVLVEVASRLSQQIRKTDMVARLGGDEFAILLRNIEAPREAERVARGILQAVPRPIVLSNGVRVSMTFSIGFTLSSPHSQPAALLDKADAAMYRSKQRGGGWSVL
ncbi:diguanylate cyclase [Edwardsiella piscicida]|uniref:diguanylate cyclase domain-containing protein n=1 Tax=Edwardsiella piscicida TaxID=1263550 RepID=UPI001CED6E5E|nr:diguanylate cyclase [Edwardsiella piscicida]AOP43161.2 diguanylate cyclase [Edwardsiella piscicida]